MKWIDIKEELPEYNKTVIICYYKSVYPFGRWRVDLGYRSHTRQGGEVFQISRGKDTMGVKFWMPIPKRPR